ncbi:unnamed protein product [Owenia fusiformis]|uniref:Uncharacterized protein n=1 Tax=Owenia fusiformis TaxID=6347 RepID=A0A8J1YDD5_OWEFU|nr:unnamed protein product [Owenia fusiformis]
MQGINQTLNQLLLLMLIGLVILYSYIWIWHDQTWTVNTTHLNHIQNYETSKQRKNNGNPKKWNQIRSHNDIREPSVHHYQGECKDGSMSSQLSLRMFKSIETIMNPPDCSKAKYLLCEWPFMAWGLGSMMHQISYCFSVALATNRVLLISAQWKFIPESWYYYLLQPSTKCWDFQYTNYTFWYDLDNSSIEKSNVQVVRLILMTNALIKNKTRPRPLPENLMDSSALWNKLTQLHQSPALWVIGQLMGYLIQPSPSFSQQLEDLKRAIGFVHPIIGVHIRRGDKITEADPIPTYKYIERIEAYINQLGYRTSNDKVPSIFFASDNRKLIGQIKQHYTQYNIIHVPHYFSKTHLDLIMFDILLLKECDYFIGTFSSNVGRLVYELQQSMYADASCLAESLDDSYTTVYCCGLSHNQQKMGHFQPNCSFESTRQQYDIIEACN